VNLSGLFPSCCIHWKSCIAFSGCPSFTHFLSFLFRAKLFNCTVPGAISAATEVRFCRSWIQSASYVSSCLKSAYLSLAYNQKSRSCWWPMYSTSQA
jgi:hypothetical protein